MSEEYPRQVAYEDLTDDDIPYIQVIAKAYLGLITSPMPGGCSGSIGASFGVSTEMEYWLHAEPVPEDQRFIFQPATDEENEAYSRDVIARSRRTDILNRNHKKPFPASHDEKYESHDEM